MEYKEYLAKKYKINSEEENNYSKFKIFLFLITNELRISKKDLLDFTNKSDKAVNARRIFIHLLKIDLQFSLSEIARLLETTTQTISKNILTTSKFLTKEIIYHDFLNEYELVKEKIKTI